MPAALLTGGSGFCGRHLADLLRQEAHVRIYCAGRGNKMPADIAFDEYCQLDIQDPKQVANLVSKLRPNWVFHLAGISSGPAEEIYRTNFLGTLHLMESLREHALEARVLLVGSAAEYGLIDTASLPVTEDYRCLPVEAYGISKHAMTLAGLNYARNHRMKVVIARPFNIIGVGVPASLVVGAVLHRAKQAMQSLENPVVKAGNLKSQRDFVAVNDVVGAYVRMIRGERWGEIFNLCSGHPRSVHSIVKQLFSHSARPITLEVDPALVRPSDAQIVYGSWEKAHLAFGFKPATSIEDSLRAVWEYVMKDTVRCV